MKKRLLIITIFIVIISILIFFIFNKNDKKGFYSLKDDNIKSITSIVGNRELIKKSKSKKGSTIIKTYKYINIKDPYTDLSKYISYLQEKSNFIPTKNFNLINKEGTIQISRYSTNKDFIIIIDISYNKNSYTIKITRGKGKIKTLNNS